MADRDFNIPMGPDRTGSIDLEPIDFGDKGFIELTEDTEPNFLGFTRTMGEFLRDEWEEEQTETEGMKLE